MLRRLHPEQPESFAFTPANLKWAEGQIAKYPEGRQASAVIPLLWRAQEQEGWLSRPAIETVADLLGMAYIRVLEVATFYFMFQLHPVGKIAHVQVCGTTSCMICGAEDLMSVCREKIAVKPFELSADGNFSWEEVECLGACANAPMVQIGKDFYEDLTTERLAWILDELAAGRVPTPGPQNGRYAAEPLGGPVALKDHAEGREPYNASVARAVQIQDTVKRIDGTEPAFDEAAAAVMPAPVTGGPAPAPATGERQAQAELHAEETKGRPEGTDHVAEGAMPPVMDAPVEGREPDVQKIKGIGPVVVEALAGAGIYYLDQVAAWTPAEAEWVSENVDGCRGRVQRGDWIGQAKALLASGE